MIETGGLAILFGWLIFGGLLCVLAFIILHNSAEAANGPPRKSADPAPQASDREQS